MKQIISLYSKSKHFLSLLFIFSPMRIVKNAIYNVNILHTSHVLDHITSIHRVMSLLLPHITMQNTPLKYVIITCVCLCCARLSTRKWQKCRAPSTYTFIWHTLKEEDTTLCCGGRCARFLSLDICYLEFADRKHSVEASLKFGRRDWFCCTNGMAHWPT